MACILSLSCVWVFSLLCLSWYSVVPADAAGLFPVDPHPFFSEWSKTMQKPETSQRREAIRANKQYLRICSRYGDVTNQLVYIIKLYGLAWALNRTLVIPNVMHTKFFDLYDRKTLEQGPVPFITGEEYFALGVDRNEERCWPGTQSSSCRCPRLPPPQEGVPNTIMINARELFSDKRNWRLWEATRRYPMVPCLWQFLQPSHAIATALAAVRSCLPDSYFGVHHRPVHYSSKEGCTPRCDALKELYSRATHGTVNFNCTGWECSMPPHYLLPILHRQTPQSEWAVKMDQEKWFLGTDGSDVNATQKLVEIGAQLSNRLTHTPKCKAAAFLCRGPDVPRGPEGNKYGRDCVTEWRDAHTWGAGLDTAMPKDALNSPEFLQFKLAGPQWAVLDQFMLSNAAVYVGNPFSSFSGAICDMRRAWGRECQNLPLTFKPCMSYPDQNDLAKRYLFTQK